LAGVGYNVERGEFSLFELVASRCDGIVASFIEQAMRQDALGRRRIGSALRMDDFYTLLTFARRCVVVTLREGNPAAARAGLDGLSLIELERVDWRDVTVAAALLSYAIGRSGADAPAAFRSAAVIASPPVAQILTRFASEPVSNLRPWGMREIGTAKGVGLVDDDGKPYASTVDLRSIGRAVADLVEADVWRIDRVTTGAEVAAVWLGRGDDPTGAAVAVQRTVACLSMTGWLVEEGPVVVPDQLLLIYVLQAATETDARTIVAAAGPGPRGGFAALSVRRGTLVVIMIARSVRAGVAPYEHGRSLERFASGLSSIMSDRPTS
jgi:hypothetical protein